MSNPVAHIFGDKPDSACTGHAAVVGQAHRWSSSFMFRVSLSGMEPQISGTLVRGKLDT